MSIAASSSGSGTCRTWKRRVSAGSFSMCRLYSAQVVAPIVRIAPRASAGLSRLAASPVPAWPPAPISVWISSTNRITGTVDFNAASSTPRRRASNSPFMLAPASSAPTSRFSKRTPTSLGGTSPAAMAHANPSTTAVLPTPASPVSKGLFCRRRSSTSIMVRISSSRPTTGSISPLCARAVRSVQNCSSGEPFDTAERACEASPGTAGEKSLLS